jgi:hypothetical protein
MPRRSERMRTTRRAGMAEVPLGPAGVLAAAAGMRVVLGVGIAGG